MRYKEEQVREVLELAEKLELPVTITIKSTDNDVIVVSISKVNMHNSVNVIVINNELTYFGDFTEDLREFDIDDIKKITIIFD